LDYELNPIPDPGPPRFISGPATVWRVSPSGRRWIGAR